MTGFGQLARLAQCLKLGRVAARAECASQRQLSASRFSKPDVPDRPTKRTICAQAKIRKRRHYEHIFRLGHISASAVRLLCHPRCPKKPVLVVIRNCLDPPHFISVEISPNFSSAGAERSIRVAEIVEGTIFVLRWPEPPDMAEQHQKMHALVRSSKGISA